MQQGTRCIRRQFRWLFGQFHEETDAPGPVRGRSLTSARALAPARKLLIPGCSIGLIFLIVHGGLVEPERIRVAYPAALVSGPVGLHGAAVYLQPDSPLPTGHAARRPGGRRAPRRLLCFSLEGPYLICRSRAQVSLGAGQIALAYLAWVAGSWIVAAISNDVMLP